MATARLGQMVTLSPPRLAEQPLSLRSHRDGHRDGPSHVPGPGVSLPVAVAWATGTEAALAQSCDFRADSDWPAGGQTLSGTG
jgi:hypothetical protein